MNEIAVFTVLGFNRKLHKYLSYVITPGFHHGINARSKKDSSPKTVLFARFKTKNTCQEPRKTVYLIFEISCY